MTTFDLIQQAKDLGAVSVRYYDMPKRAFSYSNGTGWTTERISAHFFNRDGLEIAYFHFTMAPFTGLVMLDQPRTWSDYYTNHPDYSCQNL